MDSDDILKSNDITGFDRKFLKFLSKKSHLHCHPTSNRIQDEEYNECKSAFQELERFVIGSETLETGCLVSDSVCGKTFKNRETVYICRDCATDSTCVLCRSCFVNSEHIKHNYQMFSSNGGGYCDCGDTEAWKMYPRCTLHGGNNVSPSDPSIETFDNLEDIDYAISKLPDGVKMRFLVLTKQIFETFKYFVMRPLCKDDDEARRAELERELNFLKSECLGEDLDEYALVLYNNEIHNFDQVINLFKRCLSCSAEQAMEYANIVDRDGRCVAISMNVLKDIEEKQQDILTKSKAQTKVELLCRLHQPMILSIQNFLLHTLRWLLEFANQYSRLRLLLCQYMFHDVRTKDELVFSRSTFINDVFVNHIETWKMARSATANFLMAAVMKELYFKKLFAVEFVTSYKMIIGHYSIDDHNIQDSLISLSCQIFTIISLAKFLLDNHNVLRNVIQLTYDELLKHSKPMIADGTEYPDILIFHKDENEMHKKFDSFERHLKSLGDVIYLLTSLLTSLTGYEGGDKCTTSPGKGLQQWTDVSVVNFLDYFNIFAEILSLIQETNTIERIVEHHIEHDPQWRTGIILMYDLVPCITLTGNLIISNDICWDLSFDIFRQVVIKRLINFESKKIKLFEYNGYKANIVDNDWPNKYVSVIKPLHRFMSALLLRRSYLQQLTELEVDCLFDQALQMVVFTSQQACNMWIRNGSVPYILTQQMKCLTLSSEMFDRDVQLIQQLALCMRPEEFIVKCIHKFELKNYFISPHGVLPEKKSLIQRAEDFLHLLIMTLFFRHRPGVGEDVTVESCYENIVLHILCVKSMTHSKIMKKLPLSVQRYPKGKLLDIIDKVADQTKQSQIVMFSAKKPLIVSSFDRFSLYYTIQDRNEAELYVQSVLKNDIGAVALSSPEPIQLSKDFSGLYNYLSDACFIRVLDRILHFCNEKRNSEYWTDTMLDMVLYLIGACLMEDMKVLDTPKQARRTMFIETALIPNLNIKIIDNLELLCDKITSDQQLALIKWTVRKWHDIKKKMAYDLLPCEDKMKGMDVDDLSMIVEMDTECANVIHQTKLDKADAAKRRRQHLMDKMKTMQKKFMNNNVDLLLKSLDPLSTAPADVDRNPKYPEADLTCILCQEKSDGSYDRPIVAIAGAWRSTVLAKHPFTSHALDVADVTDDVRHTALASAYSLESVDKTFLVRESLSSNDPDVASDIDRVVTRSIWPMLDHPEETFITTCGHVMHYDCKTRYMSNMIKQKQNIARTKGILYPRIYNRCPLCKCVCNIDIPISREEEVNNNPVPLCTNRSCSMTFSDWVTFFTKWTPVVTETKKLDRPMHWWDKLGHQLSNIMKMTIPFKKNDSQASDDDLLSCLAFRVGLAIKLQPSKLTKETYTKYESVCSSISESSLQDIIELDYAVAYTISVWEQLMSKECSSLLTDMPERHVVGLHHLIKAVRRSHEQLVLKDTLNRNCQSFLLMLQQMLFDCTKSSLHKVWLELHKYRTPLFIAEVDFIYIMTSLLFMISSFNDVCDAPLSMVTDDDSMQKFLDKTTYNTNVVRLVYQFVSVQSLLSLRANKVDNIEVTFTQLRSDSPDIWTDVTVDDLFRLHSELTLTSAVLPQLSKIEVAVCFSRAVMPYLRCAAFLLTAMGAIKHQTHFDNCDIEFNHLMRVLDLTVVSDLSQGLPSYIKNHLQLVTASNGQELQTVWGTKLPHSMPQTPPSLINLPLDFTDVITLCLDRGCSLRQQVTGAVTEMTLCLICGDTFCLNGYCCRRPDDSSGVLSGAQIHARQCHAGYALFLNTRNSKIVVMFYQARWQISLDPIYLDRYGENDIDLRKGNPLFLDPEAYAKLQRSWLNHSIGCIVNDGFQSIDFFV